MILVTGHKGYIGQHLTKRLDELGMDWQGFDVKYGRDFDCCNYNALNYWIGNGPTKTIIHLAAFKSIPDSINSPAEYLQNNINATTNLVRLMGWYGIRKIVFSSSCSVYGAQPSPIREDAPIKPENPYALSKAICEQIIMASKVNYSILRYFNPIGERHGIQDNSPDGIQQKMREGNFQIYGGDHPTKDGTPVRDFIDIDELVEAHIKALDWNNEVVNIGTGQGKSVKQLADELGVKYTIGPRREGDVSAVWADATQYKTLLKNGA